MDVNFDKIVQLSHRMLPGREPFDLKVQTFDVADLGERGEPHSEGVWYVASDVFFSTHCGTHIEFPYHHWKDGDDGLKFPITKMIGPATVLNFVGKKAGDNISLEEIQAKADKVQEGDFVFLRFDFDKKWRTDDWEPYPYIDCDALEWLLDTKKVRVIGTDATSLENFNKIDQPNHEACFKRGAGMVESLKNLAEIEEERALVFILPLPIEGIDACPVRIVAVKDGGIIN